MWKSSTVALSFVILAGCGGATPAPVSPVEPASVVAETPVGRLPSDVTPLHYNFDLAVDPRTDRYSGSVDIRVQVASPRESVFLHADDVHIRTVTVNEHAATANDTDQDGVIRVDVMDGPVAAGEATLHFEFDAPFRIGGDAVFKTSEGGEPYIFTQFEPISARLAFPCFDEPGWKTPIDFALRVPADMDGVANARALSSTADEATHTKRIQFATTEALPIYLLAFAVGKLDIVEGPALPPNAVRTTPLEFRGVAMHGHGSALRFAMEKVPAIIAELERYTGIAYPFDKLDILAIREFPGAMENAGAVMFDESLLLVDPTTMSVWQERQIMNVLTHELAHQWFGNLVTMAWWDDLWLNEAFATWMATRVIGVLHPRLNADADRFDEMTSALRADSRQASRRIRQPIESSHDILNAFDDITYSKGAAVLAMIESWMGAENFQRGIHAYLSEHARRNATVDDLARALVAVSNPETDAVLRSFVDQGGSPFVEATLECNATTAHLQLKQSHYVTLGNPNSDRRFHFPVCARYGTTRASHEACVVMSDETADLPLPEAHGCPAFLTPNAGGRGYYQFTLDAHGASLNDTLLTARERAMSAESLVAAMRGRNAAGAPLLGASDALVQLWPRMADPDRIVAQIPMNFVRGLLRYDVYDDVRDAIAERVRTTMQPSMRRLGWEPARGRTEDGDVALARADVVATLAFAGRDPAVRAEAVRRARAFLGLGADNALHPDAVQQDLLNIVLNVAVQDDGAPIFDALIRTYEHTSDAVLQEAAIEAMGSAIDPALLDRARTIAATQLGTRGMQSIVGGQLRDPRTRRAAFDWFMAHFDEVRAHIPPFVVGYLPRMASGFCSDADAARVQQFFAPRIESVDGGPPQLRLVLEEISACSAFVAAQGDGIQAFFRVPFTNAVRPAGGNASVH